MRYFTFYLNSPDEETELGVYKTIESAKDAAIGCDFQRFIIAEIEIKNQRVFEQQFVEVPKEDAEK